MPGTGEVVRQQEQRKARKNDREKQRRQDIKTCFDQLATMLDIDRAGRAEKCIILSRAIEYIHQVERDRDLLRDQLHAARGDLERISATCFQQQEELRGYLANTAASGGASPASNSIVGSPAGTASSAGSPDPSRPSIPGSRFDGGLAGGLPRPVPPRASSRGAGVPGPLGAGAGGHLQLQPLGATLRPKSEQSMHAGMHPLPLGSGVSSGGGSGGHPAATTRYSSGSSGQYPLPSRNSKRNLQAFPGESSSSGSHRPYPSPRRQAWRTGGWSFGSSGSSGQFPYLGSGRHGIGLGSGSMDLDDGSVGGSPKTGSGPGSGNFDFTDGMPIVGAVPPPRAPASPLNAVAGARGSSAPPRSADGDILMGGETTPPSASQPAFFRPSAY